MKMKQNTDWTDVLREALRDAEVSPSEGGWERLQRDLEAADAREPEPVVLPLRKKGWRIYGPRIAAAAAVVLLGLVVGELLWRPDGDLLTGTPSLSAVSEVDRVTNDRPVAETGSVAGADSPARAASDGIPPQSKGPVAESGTLSGAESLRKTLAEASGWPQHPADDGVRNPQHTLLAQSVPSRDDTATERRRESVEESTPVTIRTEEPSGTDSRSRAISGEPGDLETSETGAARKISRNGTQERRAVAASSDLFEEPSEASGSRPSKTSLALFAGGGMTGNGGLTDTRMLSYSIMENDAVAVIGNGNNLSPMQRRDYAESSFRHHLPLSVGFSVRKEFPHALSLESGVIYTLLRSDVRLPYSSDDVTQKLHFIGIPLRVNWQFVEQGRTSAYVGAGGMAEKCLSAKFGSESIDEEALQWSLLAALGIQYRLGGAVGLYFEPEVSYYLTDTELRTSRSEAPLTVTLRVGLRVLF